MNRRGFLQVIAMAAPALVLDPELALWVPGRKTFFLPSEPVYRVGCNQCGLTGCLGGNHLLSPNWITREMLQLLENNLKFAINRAYDENWVNHTRIDTRVNISVPMRWSA